MLKVILEVFKGYAPVFLKGFPSIALVISILSLIIALTVLSEVGTSNNTSPASIQKDVLVLLKVEQENALNRQLTASQSDKLVELEALYLTMSQPIDQILIVQKTLIQTQKELSVEVISSKEALKKRLDDQLALENQIQLVNSRIGEHKALLDDSTKSLEQIKSDLIDMKKSLGSNTEKISLLEQQITTLDSSLSILKLDQNNMDSTLVDLQTDVSKLSSKIAEASVYAETADAYFVWRAAKALSVGQPDSDEQINLAKESLSGAIFATPNQQLKLDYNDWQNSIVSHLQDKKEAGFLIKLGNLLNAALEPS
jgi:chromosome segregation ATPase